MAEKYTKPAPAAKPTPPAKPAPGDRPVVKPAANPRTAEIQRRAQAMASRKPVSPQQFFQEALVELKKTTWPTRAVLTKSTTVVLALVLAVAIWVGVLDAIFSRLLNPLFSAAH